MFAATGHTAVILDFQGRFIEGREFWVLYDCFKVYFTEPSLIIKLFIAVHWYFFEEVEEVFEFDLAVEGIRDRAHQEQLVYRIPVLGENLLAEDSGSVCSLELYGFGQNILLEDSTKEVVRFLHLYEIGVLLKVIQSHLNLFQILGHGPFKQSHFWLDEL